MVFETNEAFCKKLKYTIQDDRAVIINDSAEKIGDYLEKHNFEKADHIISSLPLSMFSLELKEDILKNTTYFLSDRGQFLQFQYLPFDYKRLKKHFRSENEFFQFATSLLSLFIAVRYRLKLYDNPSKSKDCKLKLHFIKSF